MAHGYARALQGKKIDLEKIDAADTAGLDKDKAHARLQKLGEELTALTSLLAFAGMNGLLVLFQGRDASGKDGAIGKVMEFCRVLSTRTESFKAPSEEERAHDFLWRVHRVTPRRGQIVLFNRSHYEDVIAARVLGLVPEERWRPRYAHINAFERLMADNDVLVLKFFLHVSREEQHARLLEREKGPRTAWKLDPNDWKLIPLWDDVTRAYEDALRECSSPELPWYLVPADRKWFRNLAVMERIVLTLRPLRERWLEHLEVMGKQALKEIRQIRASIRGKAG
jgi:PPK2 family polyphosphate:nucleotide phosphotransferase